MTDESTKTYSEDFQERMKAAKLGPEIKYFLKVEATYHALKESKVLEPVYNLKGDDMNHRCLEHAHKIVQGAAAQLGK